MQAQGRQRLGLQIMTVIAVLALVLFVRNGYGMGWLGGFIALNIVMLAFAPKWLHNGYYLLIAFLSLEESVFGPFSLTLMAWANPRAAGDATNLALHSPIPAVGWSIFFSLFALWCATRALRHFFKGNAKRMQVGGRTYE
jgi:hypothetical protein